MRTVIDKLTGTKTLRSLAAAWAATRRSLRRIVEQERSALEGHIDAAHARASVARQAGDPQTLIRDQLDLLPESRERVRDNAGNLRAILAALVSDWLVIWQDWWRSRDRDDRDA